VQPVLSSACAKCTLRMKIPERLNTVVWLCGPEESKISPCGEMHTFKIAFVHRIRTLHRLHLSWSCVKIARAKKTIVPPRCVPTQPMPGSPKRIDTLTPFGSRPSYSSGENVNSNSTLLNLFAVRLHRTARSQKAGNTEHEAL